MGGQSLLGNAVLMDRAFHWFVHCSRLFGSDVVGMYMYVLQTLSCPVLWCVTFVLGGFCLSAVGHLCERGRGVSVCVCVYAREDERGFS